MSEITNINGIYAADAELRNGINTLRSTVLNNTIKPLTVTEPGTYIAIPSQGTYGYSPVIVVDTTPQLPDAYEQLDYIICPSQSSQAGFRFSTSIPQSSIIDFTAALLADQSGEIAFGGSSSGNSWELYFQSMQGQTYGAIQDINGFKKAIQLDTPYRAIALSINWLDGINIGYYRLNQYIFKGKIYHAKIYNYWNNDVGDSENVICEFIPAKRLSDNKIGMYERISNAFYSSTTGTEFEAPAAV